MDNNSLVTNNSRRFTFLKYLDIFGLPVSINFNGERIYRSKFGGILSIITMVVLIAQGGYQFNRLVNHI